MRETVQIGKCRSVKGRGRSPSLALWALLSLFVCVGPLAAQPRLHNYFVTHTFTGSGAKVLTVQSPASGARNVRGGILTIDSSADCGFDIEVNGTAATETAATVVATREQTPAAPQADVFVDSDVGVGDVVVHYTARADQLFPLDLSDIELIGNGTGQNFSVRTADCDATLTMNLRFQEW